MRLRHTEHSTHIYIYCIYIYIAYIAVRWRWLCRYATTYDSELLAGRYCVPTNETLKANSVCIVVPTTWHVLLLCVTQQHIFCCQADVLAITGPLGLVERVPVPKQVCSGLITKQ